MKKCDNIILLFYCFIIIILCFAEGSGLTIDGVNCGQKKCSYNDYCSELDRTCRPCSNICNRITHNYDPILCMKDCQDYIHDARYIQKDGAPEADNLRATVVKLSHMVTVTLTLVCFMLVVLAAVLCFQLYRYKKKKNISFATIKNKLFAKKNDSNTTNKVTTTPKQVHPENGKPDLRLEMPNSTTIQTDHSPMTTTTTVSRRPAEDNTLDYAYDNPAMSSASPSPNGKPSNESSF